MTLKSVLDDIRKYGRAKLKEHGLEVRPARNDDPGLYDDEIVFRTQAGRTLAVKVQVSSYGSGWGAAAINHYVFKEVPVGRLGFKHGTLEGAFEPIFLTNDAKASVDRIMREIEKSGFTLEPVDDLEERIVTDFRLPAIITGLERVEELLTGVSEFRFAKDSDIVNRVSLYCDGEEFIRAELTGEHKVTVTNVLRGEDKTVAGDAWIRDAIRDLALASYSASPGI
ncbi:hypothetical protein [Rhizobium sp. MHM7A]|uniref:hypothetical protein n=1 Tax=Rhizobium sp. MHM7A TaxID=2583233 RepID=UPI001105A6F6|nr:hypothetical protein [Rhizobium sp. MHM7A]TLX16001.1 hypothetical protein FFR93_01400 [Rhizobium sp. MHM7A]